MSVTSLLITTMSSTYMTKMTISLGVIFVKIIELTMYRAKPKVVRRSLNFTN